MAKSNRFSSYIGSFCGTESDFLPGIAAKNFIKLASLIAGEGVLVESTPLWGAACPEYLPVPQFLMFSFFGLGKKNRIRQRQ